jgi:hypothetical protein
MQAITSLDFSNVNYSQKSDISAPNIIFLTLAQIRKAHYRYIFDDTPFQFTPIMGLIRENICRYRGDSHLSSTKSIIYPIALTPNSIDYIS